jgi:hypothetical protein
LPSLRRSANSLGGDTLRPACDKLTRFRGPNGFAVDHIAVFPSANTGNLVGAHHFDEQDAFWNSVPTSAAGVKAKIACFLDSGLSEGVTKEGLTRFLDTLYEATRLIAVQS